LSALLAVALQIIDEKEDGGGKKEENARNRVWFLFVFKALVFLFGGGRWWDSDTSVCVRK